MPQVSCFCCRYEEFAHAGGQNEWKTQVQQNLPEKLSVWMRKYTISLNLWIICRDWHGIGHKWERKIAILVWKTIHVPRSGMSDNRAKLFYRNKGIESSLQRCIGVSSYRCTWSRSGDTFKVDAFSILKSLGIRYCDAGLYPSSRRTGPALWQLRGSSLERVKRILWSKVDARCTTAL